MTSEESDSTKNVSYRDHSSPQIMPTSAVEIIPTLDNSGNEFGYTEDIEVCTNEDLSYNISSKSSSATGGNSGVIECHHCQSKYKNKRSLSNHIRRKHKGSLVYIGRMLCLEGGCSFRGNRITTLISHLIRVHQKKFQCEKVTFQCKEEFFSWKMEAEERCRSVYSAYTSARKLASGDKKVFFNCSRSGFIREPNSDSKISTTNKKSKKINAVCTSFMDVRFSQEGGAVVYFCKTHYGHREDDTCIKMNDIERAMIRDLIVEGLTASEIISEMKTRLPSHRHQLLRYANVRNVSVRHNLPLRKGKGLSNKVDVVLRPEDDVSVKSYDNGISLIVDDKESESGYIVKHEIASESILCHEKIESEPAYIVKHEIKSESIVCREQSIERGQASTIEQLKKEVEEKAQTIVRLSSSIVSKSAQISLNEKLSNIIDYLNQEYSEVLS